VEPLPYRIGDFPSIIETKNGTFLVIYDGIYVPQLVEGGRFIVRGLKGKVMFGADEVEAIIVGVREALT